ncbi:MAG: YesL family protein [Oscillospiraceae bacterium]|nr:YesL family protein [Oscillospiraceae bacterium]
MLNFLSPNSPLGRWLAFFLDALLISVAWAVCSLPVVTIGASTSALHRVALNWMRDRSDCDLKNFFAAFRENLKGGTAVWLILLVPLAVILFNAYAVWIALVEASSAAKWMILLTLVVWMAAAVYAFALQAAFENPPMRTVVNALRIAASHLTTTLILIGLFALAVFCTLVFPYGAFLYVPVCVFLAARPTWNVFVKVMGNPDVTVGQAEEEKENDP